MAGSEGFDPSLIETEALLKKMKPRPANLSAARIVYEAGRAVGKEEMQAQLAQGGFVLAGAPLSTPTWKKWLVPSWAASATALCLLLLLVQVMRAPSREEPLPHHAVHPPGSPVIYPTTPSYNSPGYSSSGYRNAPVYAETPMPPGAEPGATATESKAPEMHAAGTPAAPPEAPPETLVQQPKYGKAVVPTANESDNRSGVPRQGRDLNPPPPKERNLAEFIQDLLPKLKSRRGFDAESIQEELLSAESGKSLSPLGLIKTP